MYSKIKITTIFTKTDMTKFNKSFNSLPMSALNCFLTVFLISITPP